MNSATQNSAKGWNQSPIKITVGATGGPGGAHHMIDNTGKGPGATGVSGAGYVPSFIGSSKGDKKSKINF
jgi:hypothetical protein